LPSTDERKNIEMKRPNQIVPDVLRGMRWINTLYTIIIEHMKRTCVTCVSDKKQRILIWERFKANLTRENDMR